MSSRRSQRSQRGAWSAVVTCALLVACSKAPEPAAPIGNGPAVQRAPAPGAPAADPYVESLRAQVGAQLTLDAKLQAATGAAVRAIPTPAAVVALEPDTGVVRAVYSVPGERGDPLTTPHVPASTFKVFTALAALEAGTITPSTVKTCNGVFPFAGKELRCPAAHGPETVVAAITRSCNGFFYQVATEMDHRALLELARRYGFGERTGIELADAPGTVESAARAEGIHADPGSTVPLLDAIGHGEIEVTLLQLARAFAVFANGGKLVRLTLTGSGSVEHAVDISPANLALIRGALFTVVDAPDGTAHDVAIPGLPFAGKTGSADAPPVNGKPALDDRWFVAYTPLSGAKLLVAARVEHVDGVHDAKHVVRAVLDASRAP